MKLVENAGRIALRAHSMWANYLGIACLIAPELIFWLFGIDTNPRIWWIAGIGLIVYGIIGRLKDQGIDSAKKLIAATLIGLSALMVPDTGLADVRPPYSDAAFERVAIPHIAKWEGVSLTAYRDIVGVWTICFGETKGVRPGDSHTMAECQAMLAREVMDYRSRLHLAFTDRTITHRLTPQRDAAYVSLAYNVGVAATSKSTAVRRLNAGNIRGGCEAIGWYNRAGGRVVRGLVNRRADDTKLCLAGL